MTKRSIASAALAALLLLLNATSSSLPHFHPVRPVHAAADPTQALPPSPQGAGLRLVQSSARGLVLELLTPSFQLEPGTAGGQPCQRLSVPGYAETDAVGAPRLPVRGAMVGIPPWADLTVTLLDAGPALLPGRYDLCPLPRPVVQVDPAAGFRYAGVQATRDPAAYAAAGFQPSSLAAVVSTGLVRSQRVAQLRLHPFQYDPVTGQLRHYPRLRVALDFGPGPLSASPAAVPLPRDPFEEVLRRTLLNYGAARPWRLEPSPPQPPAAPAGQDPPAYKLLVDRDAIYRVTPADLLAAGANPATIDPRTFRLHTGGREVALYVAGQAGASFDAGDELFFYGQEAGTRHTATNVYWLTWGGARGRRMPELDGTPAGTASVPASFYTTQRLEEDRNYQAPYPTGPDGDHWYWNWIWATSPTTNTYTTTLRHVATQPLSTTVRGLFQGYDATPQHHTRVRLNGHLAADATWAPTEVYTFEVDLPQSYLAEGTNSISVASPLDGDISEDYLIVNWFEIDYHDTYVAEDDLLYFDVDAPGTWELRLGGFSTSTLDLFDLTAPLSPTRILSATAEISGGSAEAGGTYTLTFQHTITAEHHYLAQAPAHRLSPLAIEQDRPSDLRSTANGADYLLITHADFYTGVLPLAAHRAAQDLRTLVVDVQDVYDEFSYGLFDPQAIHDFLAYAYAHWQPPAPAYVLLIGDGNYDPRDNYGRGEPSYIPPYLADVDPWIREVPTTATSASAATTPCPTCTWAACPSRPPLRPARWWPGSWPTKAARPPMAGRRRSSFSPTTPISPVTLPPWPMPWPTTSCPLPTPLKRSITASPISPPPRPGPPSWAPSTRVACSSTTSATPPSSSGLPSTSWTCPTSPP
jgi:hypothetical protein